MAVFTSGELATVRAAISASRRVRAPRTAHLAPACSRPRRPRPACGRAAPRSASSARANWRRPLPAALERRVLGQPVGEDRHRVAGGLIAVHRDPVEASGRWPGAAPAAASRRATIASVARKQNMVAMCGSSMPTPLAMPPIVTGRPARSNRRAASFGRVSVVMMASAAQPAALRREPLDQLGQPGPDLVHRQRLADHAGRGDQHLPRRDPQQLAGDAGHLARVLDALLAGAHVGAAARRPGWPGRGRHARAPARRAPARP